MISIIIKNNGKSFNELGVNKFLKYSVAKQAINKIPTQCVRIAPPFLSATGPNNTLDKEPIRGPKNA